jgi:hypothetical protein
LYPRFLWAIRSRVGLCSFLQTKLKSWQGSLNGYKQLIPRKQ